MIYNFFALSTYRWELLCNLYKDNTNCTQPTRLKKLCSTRWSSKHDVCIALLCGYGKIKDALVTISNDDLQKKETKHETLSILNKISTLEFVFMICMWTPILKRFNATSLNYNR